MFQAAILGLVQALTEFLPISSSAHLKLVPWLFGWPEHSLAFDVALHLGTALALIIYFWRDWVSLVTAGFSRQPSANRRLFWIIVLATIPGALAGVALENAADTLFRSPYLIAAMLAFFGILLGFAESLSGKTEEPNVNQGLMIGVAQALALVPGASRSGITMTAGMGLGLSKEGAARFSFLLATPIILGAGLKEAPKLLAAAHQSGAELLIGFLVSAIVGYAVIHWFMRFIRKQSLWFFAAYRVLAAILIAAVALARR